MKGAAKAQVRRMAVEDIPAAMELSTEAGWNQTAEDWRMLTQLAPETCLAIYMDGELASTAILLCYGSKLAWLGMVLTRRKFRGQGLARRLLSETLALANQMKIETVKLDATDQGQPLYEKLGFRCEQLVERWERAATGSTRVFNGRSDSLLPEHLIADRESFGADRSELLGRLAGRNGAFVSGESYALMRPGRVTSYMGPCVSPDAGVARSLIECGIRNTGTSLLWDLLKQNHNAERIAIDLGFGHRRTLTRMVRGKELRGREDRIYALGGFEFG
jgi:GNAT superfamily N-acetyltransferase